MNQKELKQEIKAKSLRNFYIFCCDDYFLKKLYLNRIIEACNCNVEIIDVESEDDIDILKQRISSTRLFSTSKKRLIHARIHFVLSSIFAENKSNNIVILDPVECKNIKHKNLVKFQKPTYDELNKFIDYKIRPKKIEQKAKNIILEQFKDKNTSYLNNFMDKLLLYTQEEKRIGYDNTVKVLDVSGEIKLYAVVSYVLQRNQNRFFESIDSLLDNVHPSVLIFVLSNEAIKILAAHYVQKKDLPLFQIKQDHFSKYKNYFQNLGEKKVIQLIDTLYDMDVIVKSLSLNGFKEIFKARMFEWFI